MGQFNQDVCHDGILLFYGKLIFVWLCSPEEGSEARRPHFPYMFLLCAERLSALIASKDSGGVIQGVFICQGAPSIHHLLFADDSFIFAHATWQDCETIKEILGCFEEVSGQQANFQNRAICFSRNIKRFVQEFLASVLRDVRVD